MIISFSLLADRATTIRLLSWDPQVQAFPGSSSQPVVKGEMKCAHKSADVHDDSFLVFDERSGWGNCVLAKLSEREERNEWKNMQNISNQFSHSGFWMWIKLPWFHPISRMVRCTKLESMCFGSEKFIKSFAAAALILLYRVQNEKLNKSYRKTGYREKEREKNWKMFFMNWIFMHFMYVLYLHRVLQHVSPFLTHFTCTLQCATFCCTPFALDAVVRRRQRPSTRRLPRSTYIRCPLGSELTLRRRNSLSVA